MYPNQSRRLLLACLLCLTLSFIFIASSLQAQSFTPKYTSMISNSRAFYEYLPQAYSSESQSYPLIVFVHGVGELGDGSAGSLETVLRNGPPRLMRDGTFPTSFTVNNQVFKFIVISPQFVNWPSPNDIQGVIDYAVRNYRVNTNRIYLTGLSMGGGVVWDYASASSTYANRLAAIFPVCGASGSNSPKAQIIASANLPVWATHNQDDPTVSVNNTNGWIYDINNASPRPSVLAKKTIFPKNDHDAWSTSYATTFRENNLNVYEWMLQYQKGTSAPVNQLPSVNAGNNVTITLPASSVILNGSASDPDGNITGYSWAKIAGPSQFSINNSNITNPTISNLVAGTYTFRLTANDNGGASNYDDIDIIVNNAPAPGISLPGRVEAENYSSMSGVQIENTSDVTGSKNVGFIDSGDWMDFSVSVSSGGTYIASFRVATPYGSQQLQLRNAAGGVLATVNIPQTGAYQAWTTVTASVNLPAGNQTLRVLSTNGGWNFNWMEFGTQTNQISTGTAIPGRIESENYANMFGVQVENTADESGAKNVGFIDAGDWMDYAVTVSSAGTYTLNIRIASPNGNQQLQVRNSSGNVLTTVNVPQTGAYQSWTTVSATITLPAGNQTLRVYAANSGWNINWMEFTNSQSSTGTAIPGRIESENYSSMFGVQVENTADVTGSKNVGFIDAGDWMDYAVTVGSAGTYTVNFRIANPSGNQQLQVRNSSGNVLTTVSLPQTGAYQLWTTVSSTITLPAGNQTLRVYVGSGGWNINWMEFTNSQTPTGTAIPGRIESENYTNMFGVQVENTSDVSGSRNIGFIDTGDWMDYAVTVSSAGTYTVSFRIASPYTNQQLQLRNGSGTVLATVNVPQTGAYVTWRTVSATVTLPAGNQTLRVYSGNGGWNINWMEFVSGSTAGNASISQFSGIATAGENPLVKPSFGLFPNPVIDKVTLQLTNTHQGAVEIAITNQSGTLIKTFKFVKDQNNTQLNLSLNQLVPGIYFIKVKIGSWSESKKLIKM